MEKIASILSQFCCEDEEKREIVRYGLELFLDSFIQTLVIFAGALMVGCLPECLVIFIVFTLLRRNAGGSHAKTGLGCLLIMIILYIVGIWMNTWCRLNLAVYLILFAVCMACVSRWAPSSTNNNPITDRSIRQRKKIKSQIIVVVGFFAELLNILPISGCLVIYAICVECLSILINEYQKKREDHYEHQKACIRKSM